MYKDVGGLGSLGSIGVNVYRSNIEVRSVNITMQAFALILTVLLLICNLVDKKNVNSKLKRLMDGMLWLNICFLLCFLFSYLMDGNPQMETLNYICTAGKCGLGFPIAACYTLYIAYSIQRQDVVTSGVVKVIIGMCILAFILNVASIWTHWFFLLQGGYYCRGIIFLLNQAFGLMILVPDTLMIILYRKDLSSQSVIFLLSYAVLPMIAAVIQIPFPQIDLMCIATSFALFIIYISVHIDRGRRIAEQKTKLTDLRVSVMLSQIQPHFMYNALAVIQDLCHEKAPEAEQATIEFSEFLRSNLDSLQSTELIPFERELNHTKNYLKLEKRRFEERLQIDYQISYSDFCLPPLTLEPIVENAVRYGVTKNKDGGLVKISTYRGEGYIFIEVEDNGPGFLIRKNQGDGRSHVGLNNVRERIERMCNGRVDIESEKDMGMIVTIIIPERCDDYENISVR